MKNYLIKIDELEAIILKFNRLEIASDKACELISEICEKRTLNVPVSSNCVCKKPETEWVNGTIRVCIKCGKKS